MFTVPRSDIEYHRLGSQALNDQDQLLLLQALKHMHPGESVALKDGCEGRCTGLLPGPLFSG